jgi:hypothetical protein
VGLVVRAAPWKVVPAQLPELREIDKKKEIL